MYFHPKVTSPLGSASIQLKNSRVSERSTQGDRSFKVNHSFDFQSSFLQSPHNNKSTISVLLPVHSQLVPSASLHSNAQIKRNYLTKVIIGRMLRVREAVKAMQGLPIKIFKKGPSFAIAKEIVLRSKVNIETSLLRTLIFAEEQRTAKEGPLKYHRTDNLFVLPTPPKQQQGKSRRALLQLAELTKIPTKKAVLAFREYSRQQQALARYFGLVCANYFRSRQAAFSTIKQLPPRGTSSKIQGQLAVSQLKLTSNIVMNKYRSLMECAFSAMKGSSEEQRYKQEMAAKQIITFSRMKKKECLKHWLQIAKSTKLREEKEYELTQAKRQALERIVQRNYLKLFGQIVRRIHTFKKAATRLGCYSKINEQKSLWRLLVHMRKHQQIDRDRT